MASIVRANKQNSNLLSSLATLTFLQSHGHSASQEDINAYVAEKYNDEILQEELRDPNNIYHIIFQNNEAAGYSKIILNSPYDDSPIRNITKLERIYLLKEFYDLKLGLELFTFIVQFTKAHDQAGIWLYVWKENQKAISFYKKNGFIITGSYDFAISKTHSNPNHQMLLKF